METKVQNQVVEKEVKNVTDNNKTEKMNNKIIDFSSVLGKKEVAKNAVVDQQVVNDLFNAFMSIPSSVEVKFKNKAQLSAYRELT